VKVKLRSTESKIINIPSEIWKEAGWKIGDEVEIIVCDNLTNSDQTWKSIAIDRTEDEHFFNDGPTIMKYGEGDEEPMDDGTVYPVKFTWDRAGEQIETLEFHSKGERNAFIDGVAEGSGWDCPDWVYLPEVKRHDG